MGMTSSNCGRAFSRSLAIDGPVLLHCRTIKGKGYARAEQAAGALSRHTGSSPYPPANRSTRRGRLPITRAFGEALVELAQEDERVVGITAAMASGTGLDLLKEAIPERFFDVGIAEGHAVVFAAGLAASGKKPVVAIYSTFMQRAYDQIIHDVCLQRLPVVFAVDRAGLVGTDGATHHGAFDLSYLRILPGLPIFVPKDEAELQRMLAGALLLDGPAVIRYPRSAGVGVPLVRPIKPFVGPWVEVVREGDDALLLAVGPELRVAELAAELLAAEGMTATVAGVKRLHPLDVAVLEPLLRHHRVVATIENNVLAGGFGSAVAELMADLEIQRPLARAGLPDCFVTHGSVDRLRQDVGLTPEALADAVLRQLRQLPSTRS